MNRSIWELFELGGPLMWPLLFISILALGIILDRTFAFAWSWQRFEKVLKSLRPLIVSGDWEQAAEWCRRRGPFSHIAGVYVQQRHQPAPIREDLLRREGLLVLSQLDRGLRWLAVLAQISTLLGLLATFHIMIVRFAQGEVGGELQPGSFSTAIWQGFLTTMYGLSIAIPCSAAYQILEARVDAIARQIDILVSYLDQWRREAAENETTTFAASGGPARSSAQHATSS